MARASAPQGTPRRLPLSELPQAVGDRRVHYLHAPNFVADLLYSVLDPRVSHGQRR